MEIRYEVWNYIQMNNYLQKTKLEKYINSKGKHRFVGFSFFGDTILSSCVKASYQKNYNLDGLSNYEIQSDFNTNPIYYCRFVVALYENEIVGIISCPWVIDNKYNNSFWKYYLLHIDVNENFRKNSKFNPLGGISDGLLNKLKNSEFLFGHILQLSLFSSDGELYLKKNILDKLHNSKFSLISNEYSRTFPPTEFGLIDDSGNKIK